MLAVGFRPAGRGAVGRLVVHRVHPLIAAPLLYQALSGPIEQTVSANQPLMVVAGLLVGFGSVFGSGCTSGHGVCGLSRFSQRSMVATGTFMIVAMATVFVTRHILGA